MAGSVGDFEKIFEDMDVKTAEMNGALDSVYATSLDNGEVANLLNELRDQQQMEAGGQINAGAGAVANPNAVEVDDMQARLDAVKKM